MPEEQPAEPQADGLEDLINQFAHGEVDAQTVAASIRKDDPTRPAADLTYAEKIKRTVEDDNDYSGTFSEVVAARLSGVITAAQYEELREAFVPPGAQTGEEADMADDATDSAAATAANAAPEAQPKK